MEIGMILFLLSLMVFHFRCLSCALKEPALPEVLKPYPGSLYNYFDDPNYHRFQIPQGHFRSRFQGNRSAPDAICSILYQAGESPGTILYPPDPQPGEIYRCH